MQLKEEIFLISVLAVVAATTSTNKNVSSATNSACCNELILGPSKRNVDDFVTCRNDCVDGVYIIGIHCGSSDHDPDNNRTWTEVQLKIENIKKVNKRFVLSGLTQCTFDFPNLEEVKGSVATVEFVDGPTKKFLRSLKMIATTDEACRSTSSISEVVGNAAVAVAKFKSAAQAGINACTPNDVTAGVVTGSGPVTSGQNTSGNGTASSPVKNNQANSAKASAASCPNTADEAGPNILTIILGVFLALFSIPAILFVILIVIAFKKRQRIMATYNVVLARWCKMNNKRTAAGAIADFDNNKNNELDANDKYEPNPEEKLAVPCIKDTRVVLPGNKFINANFVDTSDHPRRFIALQVPPNAQVGNFWLMVIQEKVKSIVMLCNRVEKGLKDDGFTPKDVQVCPEYFPTSTGTSLSYPVENEKDPIKVTCTESRAYLFTCKTNVRIGVTVLTVKIGEKSSTVSHYHWQNWDHERAPDVDRAMFEFLENFQDAETPVVVHCSNGGRTGVLIMVDYIYSLVRLKQNIEDPIGILLTLRSMRWKLVENEIQYLFVIVLFMDYCEKVNEDDEKFGTFRQAYEKCLKDAESRQIKAIADAEQVHNKNRKEKRNEKKKRAANK